MIIRNALNTLGAALDATPHYSPLPYQRPSHNAPESVVFASGTTVATALASGVEFATSLTYSTFITSDRLGRLDADTVATHARELVSALLEDDTLGGTIHRPALNTLSTGVSQMDANFYVVSSSVVVIHS